jgi:hypothetical protein
MAANPCEEPAILTWFSRSTPRSQRIVPQNMIAFFNMSPMLTILYLIRRYVNLAEGNVGNALLLLSGQLKPTTHFAATNH